MGDAIRMLLAGASLFVLNAGGAASSAFAQAPMPVVSYPSGSHGGNVATAKRRQDGHFYFDTTINGTSVPMLFDTGASKISLRSEDAVKAGINLNGLAYSIHTSTANGLADMAPVTIPSLTVGGITRQNVPGVVGKPGSLSVSLLGQSFTSRLAGLKVDGDQLVLQGE